MTDTTPSPAAEDRNTATLPADTIPFGPGPEFTVDTFVGDPDDPHGGDTRNVHVARGTHGVNVGNYSWSFDEAERLALAVLASVRAGRAYRRAWAAAASGAERGLP